MELLDDKGRLFGRVNVVDALVVIFAIAVIVAGAALVFGDAPVEDPIEDPDAPRTMHVTLVSSGHTATTFSPGNVTLDGANATITDVHRTAGPRTYLRVALEGNETDEGFRFDDSAARLGRGFTVYDEEAQTGMRVIERNTTPEFDTETTTVTVDETVRTPLANAVAEGDEQRVRDFTVATVVGVETSTINDTHSELRATVALESRVVDDVPHYGGRPVRIGRTIRIETDAYEFSADIIARERE